MEFLQRTKLLLGEEKLNILQNSHVLIVGLGGVGAYAAEMVVRAGVGEVTIVDSDEINVSNINRQLLALHSTIGMRKVDVMKNRLLDINPLLKINVLEVYVNLQEINGILDYAKYDCVIDAIDTVAPKVVLLEFAVKRDYKIVSSMGSGGKMDPTQVEVADIGSTHHCHLAHMIRKRLGTFGIRTGFLAVFSAERNREGAMLECDELNKKSMVGTISYMPAVFGCTVASVAIKLLLDEGSEIRGVRGGFGQSCSEGLYLAVNQHLGL